jgi:spermidine synthase
MKLFSVEFYERLRRVLRRSGVVVAQAGVPFVQATEFSAAARNVASAFPVTGCYLIASPGYFGGHLALCWGSDSLALASCSVAELRQRFAAAELGDLRYYTPEVDRAAFALPAYIRDLFAAAARKDE